MVFVEIAQVIVVLLIIGVMLTQVIIPILMGRPTFPIFRRKNKTVDQALAEAKEAADLAKKKRELKRLQVEIEAEERGISQ
jgi:predicted DNA repair protein MutK